MNTLIFSHLEYCHTGIKEKTVDNGTLFDCFVLSEEPMTFKDAVVYCGNQGIPLAEIQTEQDHTNIIEKLQVCCNNNMLGPVKRKLNCSDFPISQDL